MTTTQCARCEEYERKRDPLGGPVPGMPTRWWHCADCGRHVERWRGEGDQRCTCGALYNAWGQQLRRDAPMVGDGCADTDGDDDGPGDLEQYELDQLRREAGMEE